MLTVTVVIILMSIFFLYLNSKGTRTQSQKSKKTKPSNTQNGSGFQNRNIQTITLDTYFFKTEKQKRDGLMHIKTPLGNKGALFKYQNPQKICIWMKNTYLPLDALFLDNKFQVIDMIKGLIPQDLTSRCSKTNKPTYFIEVDVGFIEDMNIQIGDIIKCRHIPFTPPI